MRTRVLLKAPILSQSGYGHHSRTVLRALKKREDLFDIYVLALTWGQTSWLWEDNDERKWIDSLLQKTIHYSQHGGQYDMSLQVTIPNEWEKIAPINIGITAGIETTKVSPQWIEKSYLMDSIITISEHSKWSYKNTKYPAKDSNTGEEFVATVKTPIEVVHYPVLRTEPADIKLDLTTNFNFLSVVQLSPRKNVGQTVKCFIEQFGDNEEVGLVLKLNMSKNSLIDRQHTFEGVKRILAEYPERKCKVYLLHGYMKDGEMSALYNHPKIKAFISTTHGEGFGLPIFESAYYGLPVVAPDWSGHLDFLYMTSVDKKGKVKKKPMFSRVGYTLKPVEKEAVWDGVVQADSQWAYPEDGSFKMALDDLYNDYGRFKKRAKILQKWICEEFEAEKQYQKFIDVFSSFVEDNDDNWLEELDVVVKEYA